MQTLTAEQLKRVLEGPRRVPVIDVLDQDSYEQKHIPGSVSVPLSESNFVDKIDEQVSNLLAQHIAAPVVLVLGDIVLVALVAGVFVRVVQHSEPLLLLIV